MDHNEGASEDLKVYATKTLQEQEDVIEIRLDELHHH